MFWPLIYHGLSKHIILCFVVWACGYVFRVAATTCSWFFEKIKMYCLGWFNSKSILFNRHSIGLSEGPVVLFCAPHNHQLIQINSVTRTEQNRLLWTLHVVSGDGCCMSKRTMALQIYCVKMKFELFCDSMVLAIIILRSLRVNLMGKVISNLSTFFWYPAKFRIYIKLLLKQLWVHLVEPKQSNITPALLFIKAWTSVFCISFYY